MISIVIPLYNKEKYIEETLNSLFRQTYQKFEIIIVDDGSTDNSVTKVSKFNDQRIRLITQENGGVSAARNRGIAEARYDLIAFLDADDFWDSDYLTTILKMVANYPSGDVFATNYRTSDADQHIKTPVNTKFALLTELSEDGSGILKNYFEYASLTAPPLWTSAIVCTKQSLQTLGGFPLGIRLGEDLIVWAKLAARYKIAYTTNVKAQYNIPSYTNLDNEPIPDEPDYIGNELEVLISQYPQIKTIKKYLSLWYKMRTTMFLANSMRYKAIVQASKMLYFNPFKIKNILIFVLCFFPHSIRKFISKSVYGKKD